MNAKNEKISLEFPKETLVVLRKAAKEAGLSLSDVIRMAVNVGMLELPIMKRGKV